MTEMLAERITAFIEWGGYAGVAILMTLESMVAPVPSEAVMPFAGFLIADGRFTWQGVIAASTLGSIIGSLLSYAAGYYGGRPLVDRFGKYLFLNHHHLDVTERFFTRYGQVTILISRFIPVVRHLISIPAGAGRMNLLRFSIYTVVGAGLWNWILTYGGYVLRNNWETILRHARTVDHVILAVLILVFGYVLYRLYRQSRRTV